MKKYLKSSWGEADQHHLDPKLTQRLFTTQNVMLVHYVYEPGLEFDTHSHPQEQITLVQSGHLRILVEGENLDLKKGDICAISPNISHKTMVIGSDPVESISIFTPVADNVIIQK